MTWRDKARPVIERVLRETVGKPEKEIRAALRDAYPFGERQYHPYKVWLDEIRRQRTGAKPKPRRGTKARGHHEAKTKTLDLFGERGRTGA